jgi:hypothetical protein
MADEKRTGEKTLEMRLAEVEDKLSKLHITEDELKAYQKVSGLMGGSAGAAESAHLAPGAGAYPCYPCHPCITPRFVPRINPILRVPRIFCYECQCGPCNEYGSGFGGNFGGGFGGFGT